jgi:predicted deacylase
MARLFAALILATVCSRALAVTSPASRFDRNPTPQEVSDQMRALAAAYPDVAHLQVLGYSEMGREVNYLVIADGAAEGRPAVYLNGTHHGDELASTLSVTALARYVLQHRHDDRIASLLRDYALYVQPVVNPDGMARHTRLDANGRDINRDYADPAHSEEGAFRSRGARLVKELVDRVHFRAGIAFHSGAEGVLYPWCHAPIPAADHDRFDALAHAAAAAMGLRHWAQSYFDYPTSGELIDYMYMSQGSLAVTFEVSHLHTPPYAEVAPIVRRAVAGGLAFLRTLQDLDQGREPLVADAPFDATSKPATTPVVTTASRVPAK